jgi:hypothetical protein
MFPNQTVYNLEEDSFIAGNERIYTFYIYDESGSTVNLTNATTGWKLSYFGDSGSSVVVKSGSFVVSPNYAFKITLGYADTYNLRGKFVQQPYFIDGSGKHYFPSQGIINIWPRNQ